MQTATRWIAQPEIAFGCADISYRWGFGKSTHLAVCMHFSQIVGGWNKDLQIVFPNPLAVMWECESFGLIETPANPPQLTGRFHGWTFPTLVIERSEWAERYAAAKYAHGDPAAARIKHYYLVSLNDLLHVLDEGDPECRWVDSSGT
ncbi:MAG: hypothetical protein ACTHK7_16770 [Aureliella sp.]